MTEPPLPGYYLVLWGTCVLLIDTNQAIKNDGICTCMYSNYVYVLFGSIFEAHFECHDILMLGKSPIKWRQRPDMTIAVDWDVKHQFKQTKSIFVRNQTNVPDPYILDQ